MVFLMVFFIIGLWGDYLLEAGYGLDACFGCGGVEVAFVF